MNNIKKIALTMATVKIFTLSSYVLDKTDNIGGDNYLRPQAATYQTEFEIVDDDTNIALGYDDEGMVFYKRYDPETGEYKAVSIYDDENIKTHQYGGNQIDLFKHYDDLIAEPIIYDEMQKYFPVSEFASVEEAYGFYKAYFKSINDNGCGYVSVVNYIFHMYEGREKEFEETFGFPMYTVSDNGYVDFNYEILILKFYNYALLDYEGLKYRILDDLLKDTYKFTYEIYSNTKVSFSGDFRKLTREEQAKYYEYSRTLKEYEKEYYDKWMNTPEPLAYYTNFGLPIDTTIDCLNRFLSNYGINITGVYNSYSDSSYTVDDIIASSGYTLYDVDSNLPYTGDNGFHSVIVTDFTDDGNAIISSWGNKYVYDDSDCTIKSKIRIQSYN